MRYKTLREYFKPLAIGFLLLSMGGIVISIISSKLHAEQLSGNATLWGIILVSLLMVVFTIYCYSGEFIRKRYKEEGVRFDGYIESAKESFNGKGENRYCLTISFYDNGKTERKTEWYVGNPNSRLKSRKCSVYKKNGKYLETDFDVLKKGETSRNLNIPMSRMKV